MYVLRRISMHYRCICSRYVFVCKSKSSLVEQVCANKIRGAIEKPKKINPLWIIPPTIADLVATFLMCKRIFVNKMLNNNLLFQRLRFDSDLCKHLADAQRKHPYLHWSLELYFSQTKTL